MVECGAVVDLHIVVEDVGVQSSIYILCNPLNTRKLSGLAQCHRGDDGLRSVCFREPEPNFGKIQYGAMPRFANSSKLTKREAFDQPLVEN